MGREYSGEHQSTKSDNIPVRAFLYSAGEYDKWLIRHRADILGTKQVKLPAPKCFEMYNGTSEMPDLSEKRLSDAFMQPSPGYEWTVYVLNINEGRNLELMARCMPLRAYSKFVQTVRDGMAEGRTLEEALQAALDYCMEHGLLSSYFAVNKGRLVRMMLTKYATKFHEEALREEGREEGRMEGSKEERLKSVASKADMVKALMANMKMSAQQAMDAVSLPSEEREAIMPLL